MSHKHYIHAGNRPIAIYTQRSTGVNDTRYLHADNLGSITVITNETGVVVERLSYDPFGKRRNLDGSDASTALTSAQLRHGYTEHEHLDEVGLIHMNGRVYNPTLGRFASADPFVSRPANSQSFNRYSYVRNNPLKYVDPSGYIDVYELETVEVIGHYSFFEDAYFDNLRLRGNRPGDPVSNITLGNINNGGESPGISGPNLLGVGFGGGMSSSFSGGGATIVNQSVSPTTTTVTSSTTTTANGGFSHTTTYYNGAPNGTCICGTGGTSGGATTTAAAPGVVNGSSTSFFGNFYSELAHPRPLLPSFSSAISAASRALGAISATLSLSGDTAKTNEQYVIRGGLAAPENLIRGSVQVKAPYQNLTGFSVTTAPGMTIGQLARAAQYENRMISFTTVEELATIGIVVAPTPFPGMPLHGTVVVPIPLDPALAEQINNTFTRVTNPARLGQ